MVDATYQTKVYLKQGGNAQVIASGGSLELGANVVLAVSGTNVVITGLPTADPEVIGALWANSGVLTISAGPVSV